MVISRTPFRVSLFGGGSDYPHWYRGHGGSVIGFAIKRYCYVSVRHLPPLFAHHHRVVYSEVEAVNDICDIRHPAVRHILQDFGIDRGLEIHHDGDLPARSGVGSSSSFVVGLIHALTVSSGRACSKEQLAQAAIRMEQQVINEAVGSQGQVWAAHGGMNRIDFYRNGSIDVQPLTIGVDRRNDLVSRCILFFTGTPRLAPAIAAEQIANLERKAADIYRFVDMVDETQAILLNPMRSLIDIGRLLNEAWRLKRGLASGISNARVDAIYQAGLAAGAIGGKLLGAGGGGFVLFYAEPDRQPAIRAALRDLIAVNLEVDDAGSRIVVNEPESVQSSLAAIG